MPRAQQANLAAGCPAWHQAAHSLWRCMAQQLPRMQAHAATLQARAAPAVVCGCRASRSCTAHPTVGTQETAAGRLPRTRPGVKTVQVQPQRVQGCCSINEHLSGLAGSSSCAHLLCAAPAAAAAAMLLLRQLGELHSWEATTAALLGLRRPQTHCSAGCCCVCCAVPCCALHAV